MSVTTVFAAAPGPLLVTVRVKTALPPGGTAAGETVLLSASSASTTDVQGRFKISKPKVQIACELVLLTTRTMSVAAGTSKENGWARLEPTSPT